MPKKKKSKRTKRQSNGSNFMGIPTMSDYSKNNSGYGMMGFGSSPMGKSKKKRSSGMGIPTMSDYNLSGTLNDPMGNSRLRSPSQKERRLIKKKHPQGRLIGVTNNNQPMISYDMGSIGMGNMGGGKATRSDNVYGNVSIPTGEHKKSKQSKYTKQTMNFNLKESGFGFEQNDLDPNREISKKGMSQTKIKTPFGTRVSTEIPVSDEFGNPLKNKKGGQVKETSVTYENVPKGVSAISGGLQEVSKRIKTEYEKEKEKRVDAQLRDKAFRAELARRGGRSNRNDQAQYCISITTNQNTGASRTVCFRTKAEAEAEQRKAEAQGFTAHRI